MPSSPSIRPHSGTVVVEVVVVVVGQRPSSGRQSGTSLCRGHALPPRLGVWVTMIRRSEPLSQASVQLLSV